LQHELLKVLEVGGYGKITLLGLKIQVEKRGSDQQLVMITEERKYENSLTPIEMQMSHMLASGLGLQEGGNSWESHVTSDPLIKEL